MAKAAKQVKSSGRAATNGNSATRTSNGQSPRPIEQLIRERAYQFYLDRGEVPGDAVTDWLRAEREVLVAS